MDADPLIGTLVGNYRILSLIGRGGMGDVYRAVHVAIEARAAVKVLRATPASDATAVERFMREAVAVNRIEHDRVIKITDAGQLPDRRPYLVMELLEGRSLAERIGTRGDPLPLREAADIAIDVLDVIAAAHESDIVHRDLKPGNIFLTASGRTVVLDFGVAHLIDPSTTTLTRSGATLGTPLYMAPEQVSGGEVGPFTDVYAMGIVLYELVTGVRPFRAESQFALMRAQLEDDPPEPSLLVPELPRAVEAVILKALAKPPADRYADAARMREALRAAAASIAPPPPPRREASDPVADLAFGSSAPATSSLAAEYLRAAEAPATSPAPAPRVRDSGPIEELSFASSTSSASSRASDLYDFGVPADAPTAATASPLPPTKPRATDGASAAEPRRDAATSAAGARGDTDARSDTGAAGARGDTGGAGARSDTDAAASAMREGEPVRAPREVAIARPSKLPWLALLLAVVGLGGYAVWRATRSEPAPAPQTASGSARDERGAMGSGAPCVPARGLACTRRGAVRGERASDERVVAYRGIPYAKPPVGELRWRAPELAPAWTDERRSRQSPRCVQWRAGAADGDEDCLYLDVYAPESATKLPVIVFVHGGNHVVGGAADHDGRRLAVAAGAVVVIINYRLGAFGWLAHPAIAPSGNYGLQDQIAALRWVRDEIAAFGGDPERVTLLGHSAGAVDACNLVAVPAAAKLFSRLWLASGSCYALTAEQGARIARIVAADLGCPDDDEACLRGLPAERIARARGATSSDLATGVVYYAVVDGALLAESPLAAVRAGRTPRMPVVLGTTRDEMLGLVEAWVPGDHRDPAGYAAAVKSIYGDHAPAILDAYPLRPGTTPRAALAAILSDQLTHCPTRRTARAFAKAGGETWRYVFAHRFREAGLVEHGAFHGIDLAFLFDDFRAKVGLQPTPEERALAASTMRALSGFAASGVLPDAPKLADRDERQIAWDTRSAREEKIEQPLCDRWDPYQDPR